MTQVSLKIVNEKGLHARASAKLVEVVEAFDARAEVAKDGKLYLQTGKYTLKYSLGGVSKTSTIEVR